MNRIDAFWAGAMELAWSVDLVPIVAKAGTWWDLELAFPDRLEEVGVPAEIASAWRSAKPSKTRGKVVVATGIDYPERPTPGPPVLLVDGNPGVLDAGVAIVGTRGCTPHAAQCAHRIAFAVARAGIPVISGLARGVDTHAHRGALDAGGRTVAVLGHGLSFTAPPSNVPLRKRIVAHGGACVSTWPDHVSAKPFTFPERNQWIAWLARDVVLIECPPGSGALITAVHAAQHGRQLWVVPGPAFDPRWSGVRDLLEQPDVHLLHDLDLFVETVAPRQLELEYGPTTWLEAVLSGVPLPEVAQQYRRTVTDLFAELAMLEAKGAVTRLGGGRWGASTPGVQ